MIYNLYLIKQDGVSEFAIKPDNLYGDRVNIAVRLWTTQKLPISEECPLHSLMRRLISQIISTAIN